MKRTFLLLACMAFTSPVIAAGNQYATKVWKPTPFSLGSDHLPAGYKGLDPKKFFTLFKAKVHDLEKGEFETSEKFEQRIAGKENLLSPIKTSDLYAFRMSGHMSKKYAADTQEYLLEGIQTCIEAGRLTPNWLTCEIAELIHDESYVGSNSFGATTTVTRTRGTRLALAIQEDNPLLKSVLVGSYGYYGYQDRVPVNLDKARKLKNAEFSVLFVGHISHTKIIEGKPVIGTPTIDDPTDIFITVEGIPFDLKAIIIYDRKTGEIIGQKNILPSPQ
ncbi:MAG TPA: hypothetical protein VK149_12655 [Sideroxyarcus sp.]|nr:hypothetical protein [Sideroxyarcus sp.]